MPGIPITFKPKVHAEAKAKGTIQHSSFFVAKVPFICGFRALCGHASHLQRT